MKRIYFICLSILTVIVISSCVSSLYPISDNEHDYIFLEGLLGQWADKDMQTRIIINKAEHKKYKVISIDTKHKETGGNKISFLDTSYYSGFLIQLNNQYFLDCSPDLDDPQYSCLGEETKSGLLPLHFIYKINSIASNQITIAGINRDSLQSFINSHPKKMKYEQRSGNDDILLTSNSAGLQKNILTNREAVFVFSEINILYRKK
jgi:hypothetical protein